MATYTDKIINQNMGITSGKIDGILFNTINLANGYKEISQHKIAPKNSYFDPNDAGTNKDLIINAVDIDWNGAQWPNDSADTPTTINTTGELLKGVYLPMFAKAA